MNEEHRQELIATFNIFAFNYSIQNRKCGNWLLRMTETSDLQPMETEAIDPLLLDMANIMVVLMKNSRLEVKVYDYVFALNEVDAGRFVLIVRRSLDNDDV